MKAAVNDASRKIEQQMQERLGSLEELGQLAGGR